MADSDLNKISRQCPHCSSTLQNNGLRLCSCTSNYSPVLVVEMSQTSSIASSEIVVSAERKKEKSISREPSGKDLTSRTSNVERKPCQQQWSRCNISEGKVPHIRMEDGSSIEVYRKQAEASRDLQVASKSVVSGKKKDFKISF
ncbi:serine/threonine-protein kinase 33-like isoform X1 [Marmota marmota marmota]|uniref:serine/threonine-protein kinase 33-like isoform X1 n=1 Tax=Marmota marmota marmota TaxID=9994 RepID=UPI0020921C06|nr:serine/threonine-protein kinase 33-like isoform X1 [Marmota marmota marmota]